MAPSSSKLFTPFKAIGIVTDDKVFALRYIKSLRKFVLKVPVGNCFHIYAASNLNLMNISEFLPSAITCLVSGAARDYTGTQDGTIYQWNVFQKKLCTFKGHAAEIKALIPVAYSLISLDIDNNIKVWNTEDGSLYMEESISRSVFEISAMCHPPTYLNKMLLGSRQGSLRLINFRTSQLVYTFKGWESGVTVIEPAPALDIVAIGLEDGRIIMHNLKFDETLFTLKQDWGMVTALSFRLDNAARLLSGSALGHIALWDLEERFMRSSVEEAHQGPIVSLECAQGDPIAYSSSTDNVLKAWVFDMPDGGARSYCIRDGHSEPPLKVRFHGSRGTTVLSGGLDSNLRCSSLTTMRGRSMGLACYNRSAVKKKSLKVARKMPPIIHFTTEVTREEAWDNVAALHLNTNLATTWSYHKMKLNDKFLTHSRFKLIENEKTRASCIELTVCGNYVLIGYDSGHVEKFNIQSKIHQMSFEQQDSAVRGIITDALNFWAVIGAQKGCVSWYSLRKGELSSSIDLQSGIQMMSLNRDSGLFAVALDNWSVIVIDVDTRKITRKLYGHHNQITDLAFSSDSKWLVTSSMDHSIRTWDIPTGSCIDYFLVPSPATSITLSPIDDYLVSTHVDEIGLYVWANRNCLTFVSLQPLKDCYQPQKMDLPSSSPDPAVMEDSDDEQSDEDQEEIEEDEYKSPAQLSEDFVTLDLMPTSRWLTLIKIDAIKQRNKPIEGPKVFKSVPFFLDSGAEVSPLQVSPDSQSSEAPKSKIRDISSFVLENLTVFGTLLKEKSYDAAYDVLSKKGPSNVDLEIRSLDPDMGGSREVMINFLRMVHFMVSKKIHFEVIQGYFALFMKRHHEFLCNPDEEVQQLCSQIVSANKDSWKVLENNINKSLCLLSYLKNSAVINF